MNDTLFGLKRKSQISISYDIAKREIVSVNGINSNESISFVSEELGFNLPLYISIDGVPYFPSKYEFISEGIIVYSSTQSPARCQYELTDTNFLNERAKIKQNTICHSDLIEYDVPGRKRSVSQNKIMGESANDHAKRLIDNGILVALDDSLTDWHWCHLIAYSMLPYEKAQRKNNLVCATSACNGHMANIEAALKMFIYTYRRPLGLEVTATTYQNSHLAIRIRYSVWDKKGSGRLHNEYFDALTTIKSDVNDFYAIYDRLIKEFQK